MGNAIEVFHVIYADDIVPAGNTILELQRKINIPEIFCEKWGMKVNLTKTKSCGFQKRRENIQV